MKDDSEASVEPAATASILSYSSSWVPSTAGRKRAHLFKLEQQAVFTFIPLPPAPASLEDEEMASDRPVIWLFFFQSFGF